TQLPYVVISVVAATFGYVTVALVGSVLAGFAVTLVAGAAVLLVAHRVAGRLEDDVASGPGGVTHTSSS
ncbi:hypothetical protein, partial [Nocardioides salarius]|uniref:hypothetical protein n=1 Tax=Nocardioides salarius TaxID=374513 RepID=UPI0030F71430